MSRRKQKQPQQLLSLTSGASRIENDTQLAVNSASFIPDSSLCSSSSLQRSLLPPKSRLSSEGPYSFSLPIESLSVACSTSRPLINQHRSISPETLRTSALQLLPGCTSTSLLEQTFCSSKMASPKLGLSATTTSSSSSPCASLCPPPHPGSPSRVPEGPPSPVTPSPSPGVTSAATAPSRAQLSIALILEELRVLQQRQIHQMQITEEICRQVLRLGDASYTVDTPSQESLSTLPQLCLEGDKRAASPTTPTSASQPPTSVAPLLACFSSLLPSQAANKAPKPSSSLSQILQPHKGTMEGTCGSAGAHGFLKVTPQSSTHSTTSTPMTPSTYPLALSLALPNRYLHEKSPNTASMTGQSSLSLLNALPSSVSNVQLSQQSLSGADTSSASSSNSGRFQHVCRFCGKMFNSDSALQIHLRSHTGERPFQCPVCFSRFTTRGNLKVHFLRHREQNPELSLSLLPPSIFGVALGSSGGSDIGQTMSSGGSGNNFQKKRKSRFEEDPCTDNLEVSGTSTTFSGGVSERSTPSSLPLPPSVNLALISQSLLQLNRAAAAVASITASSSSVSSSASSALATSLFSNPSLASSSAPTGGFKGSKQQQCDENTPPHVPILSPAAYSQLAQHSKLLFPSSSSSFSTPAVHSSIFNHPALGFLRTPLPSNPSLHHLTSSSHPQITFTSSSLARPSCPSTTAQCALPSSVTTSTPTSETSKLQRLVEKLEKVSPHSSSPWVLSSSSGTSSGSTNSCFSNASTSTTYVMASPTSSTLVTHDMVAALGLSANGSGSIAGGQLSMLNVTGLTSNLVTNQCGVCLRVMSCPRALRLHQATHLGERPFPCKLCGRSFSTKGSLRSHLATHHARPANARVQNSCPLCQRKFTNALVLQHHIRMHLGGQLPPDSSEDPLAEISDECNNKSLSQSKSQSTNPGTSETLHLVETDPPKSPASNTQDQTSASPTVTVFDDIKSKDQRMSASASPDLVPQSKLDSLSHPNTLTTPSSSGEQPCSMLLSDSQETDQGTGVSDGVQQLSAADALMSTSSPVTCNVSKTPMSSNDEVMDCEEAEASISSEVLPDPIQSQDISRVNAPQILESDSRPQSPELIRAEIEHYSKPGTPKHDHVNVPDKDPKTPSALETADPNGGEANSAQRASCFVKETQQHFNFGSYEREDKLETNEALDTSVPISLTPTLPSPMSRPEKKTYCCAECGKEYASRSGLKGHMKHHGVLSKTRPAARSSRSTSDQLSTPMSSLSVPATRSSAGFWNQYKTFLNTNTETTHGPPSGNLGENESARSVRSSARSRMESRTPVDPQKGDES